MSFNPRGASGGSGTMSHSKPPCSKNGCRLPSPVKHMQSFQVKGTAAAAQLHCNLQALPNLLQATTVHPSNPSTAICTVSALYDRQASLDTACAI
jgi:hypothetical protein